MNEWIKRRQVGQRMSVKGKNFWLICTKIWKSGGSIAENLEFIEYIRTKWIFIEENFEKFEFLLKKIGKFLVFIEESVILKSKIKQILRGTDCHWDYILNRTD